MFRDDRPYVVVQNAEEQYSLWPADRQPPAGWQAVTDALSREECLDHIREVWTDMRPRSLREWMAEHGDDLVLSGGMSSGGVSSGGVPS